MRTRTRRLLVGVLAGLLMAGACSDNDPSDDADAADDVDPAVAESESEAGPEVADPEEYGLTGPDFYAPPDPLPSGEHGQLLRYQPIAGFDPDGGSAWRIMYLSEAVEGDPTVVTGTLLVPDDPPPADGWKLITLAHGTTGIADECAPSKNPGTGEAALASIALGRGYAVVISDYEGLGTPGRHPYLVGPSEGRSVLDAALAARQLPDTGIGERYAIMGYSQGGHGAAWAHQLADEWAPELELVGSVSGAPPSEMGVIFGVLADTSASPDFLFMIIAGYAEAYAEADPDLVLTDAGMSVLDGVDNGCFNIGSAIGNQPLASLIEADAGTVEPWATLLDDNDPGQVSTEHPLLIVHSDADEVVPAPLSEALFNRLCDLGETVERRVSSEGRGHVQEAIAVAPDMLAWIEARMSGEPAISTCPG